MPVDFVLNDRAVSFDGEPDTPLLWAVRDEFGLTGTKYGCGVAQCGACTVHVDGKNRRACVATVASVAGKRVTTIEGLDTPAGRAVQAAWTAIDVPQCGYCQSGQVMAAAGLLAKKPKPTDADIDGALAGNVCRCATYVRIRAAIHQAARSVEARA